MNLKRRIEKLEKICNNKNKFNFIGEPFTREQEIYYQKNHIPYGAFRIVTDKKYEL